MEYVIEIFCLTTIFGYLFYKWANKNFGCFSKRNVAHEKPIFLVGNNLPVLEGRETSAELLIRIHNQFKDEKIYGYYGFRSPHFFIRDPELIQQIGIKDVDYFTNHADNNAMMSNETICNMLTVLKDEKWVDMRMMLASAFTENKISQIFHIITECNKEAINYLKEIITPNGTDIDLEDYFHRYSNDVIASAAFGLEINSHKDKDNEFSINAMGILRTRSLCVAVKSFYLMIAPQVLRIYRLNRIYIKSLAYVRRLISQIIRPHHKDKIDEQDSIDQKKGTEFFKIISAILKKSSNAVKSLILLIFPQISIIVHLFSFVQTIRYYVKGLFDPKLRQQRQKEKALLYEDTDPEQKKNTFLKMGSVVLGKITSSIKLLIFTIFPQIILISRLYTLTKIVFNYLRGKSIRQEGMRKKKKLSKVETIVIQFERLLVITKFLMWTYFPKISKILKLSALNARALNYLKGVASDTIQQRQDDKIVRQDIIHLMLEVQKQENNLTNKTDADAEDTSTKQTTKFTENEIVAQCIMFLFAGLGPMSNMLCSTVYELMKNPEIQEKLYEEVAKINEELDGAEISYELLKNMKYLDMVVCETLRKWPSVPLLDRVCSKPYSLTNAAGELVADFKPDDIICFSVYGSHFDEEYFENPFTFDPERFSKENKSKIKPLTYFPFGVGTRSCIGNTFGLMVAKIMLYHLVLEFKFAAGPKSVPDLFTTRRKIQLKQSEFFWMTVFSRKTEQISCLIEAAKQQTELNIEAAKEQSDLNIEAVEQETDLNIEAVEQQTDLNMELANQQADLNIVL